MKGDSRLAKAKRTEDRRFGFNFHHIDFLTGSRFLTPASALLSFAALAVILALGFSYGVDFAGGNEIQARFQKPITAERLRAELKSKGIKSPAVQKLGEGNEFLIRVEIAEKEEGNAQKQQALSAALKAMGGEIRRMDSVGPQIGKELRRKGALALIYSLLMILVYLGLRFDVKYAPAAVFCLFHDAMLTLGVFSLFQMEVNVQTLAAILAIIGYSLNDTIVTFDRIRENQRLFSNKKSLWDICNQSLNEVLSRTMLTSITTLLAVLSMWFLADGVIKDFAFTLGLGVMIGTYSSIYVATPLMLFMDRFMDRPPRRMARQFQKAAR